MSRRPRGLGRHCEHVSEETGEQCKAWAMKATYEDERGPRCRLHSMSPEEVSAAARHAARKSAVVRHADTEAATRLSGLDPGVTLGQLMPILREALTARLETGERDWNAALSACGTLLAGWPRFLRSSPEECRELLRRAIPPEILSDELLDTRRVYRELRVCWDDLDGLRWSGLRGLYVAEYPAWMVAPWEDARAIQKSRPADVPPDRAPVRQLPDGRPALLREGELPFLLPVEDDGG